MCPFVCSFLTFPRGENDHKTFHACLALLLSDLPLPYLFSVTYSVCLFRICSCNVVCGVPAFDSQFSGYRLFAILKQMFYYSA